VAEPVSKVLGAPSSSRVFFVQNYVFFEGLAVLIATFIRDSEVFRDAAAALRPQHDVVSVHGWQHLREIVRNRPVMATILDIDAAQVGVGQGSLPGFRRRFPHQGVVLLIPHRLDPLALFRLGKSGVSDALFLPVEEMRTELAPVVQGSIRGQTASLVVRALSPYLPRLELQAVSQALDDIRRSRDADRFAARIGFSRAFLSERFKRWGLPSIGHFLLWCRLLHASRWLTEPGRSGESVARQLGYANGAAFRRALRGYTGLTPSEVIANGGFDFMLGTFMRRYGFLRPPGGSFHKVRAFREAV